MKTIEERAREWAEEQLQGHRDYATMSDKVKTVWRESYINDYCHIATEQKAIDIALLKSKLKSIMIIAQDPTMHQERKEMEILAMIQNSLEE